MFARRREKRRFQLDDPQPPQHRSLPVRVIITPRSKRRRFRVGPTDPPQWLALPFQVMVERRRPKRRVTFTLGQRRLLMRLGAILAVTCALVAILAGTLLYRARMNNGATVNADVRSGQDVSGLPALHFGSAPLYGSLQPHDSASAGPAPVVQARAAFLFVPDRGWLLYQKNADERLPVASLTKVMTLMLAINSSNLDQQVTVGPDAAALVNSNNSYMGVSVGERLTMRELLTGLMVAGGNDAALAIADAVGGNEASFVATMNQYAVQLGLKHTHFVSADGVSDSDVSSARDMAVLSALAIQRPGVAAITSLGHVTIPQTATHKAFDLTNGNELLPGGPAAYAGADGVKTGYTAGAQYCMAFSAQHNGHLLVGVVLGEPSDQARTADATALLNWGFAQM